MFESLLKKHFKGEFSLRLTKDDEEEIDPAFLAQNNNRYIIERNIR